jgi:hypothetical protein
MKTIHLTPAMQLAGVLALVGAIIAMVLAQMPEIQRYLKVRAMD